jgi:hypothetical protein
VRDAFSGLCTLALFVSAVVLLGLAGSVSAFASDSPKFVLTQDALNKTMGVLGDLRARNLPLKIGSGDLDTEIANLQKQPGVESIITKRGLSVREFVLTYKATAQIREAEKARDNWQKILQDPDAPPQAKLDATQKLADSLKNNLFTPEQIQLVRQKMPDLETLLAPPK